MCNTRTDTSQFARFGGETWGWTNAFWDDKALNFMPEQKLLLMPFQKDNGNVVALINVAEMALASEVRATGVKFVYRKHPIWRTAQIRKQELRDKFRSEARLPHNPNQTIT